MHVRLFLKRFEFFCLWNHVVEMSVQLHKYQAKMAPPTSSIPVNKHASPQKNTKFKLYGDLVNERCEVSSSSTSQSLIDKEFNHYFDPGAAFAYPNPDNLDIVGWWDVSFIFNSNYLQTKFHIAKFPPVPDILQDCIGYPSCTSVIRRSRACFFISC